MSARPPRREGSFPELVNGIAAAVRLRHAPRHRRQWTLNLRPGITPPCVVAAGIDTLELWTRARVRPVVAAELRAMKEAAMESAQRWQVSTVELEVQAYGVRGATYIATSDTFALRVTPSDVDGAVTALVEVRALSLWHMGWRNAAKLAERLLAEVTEGDLKTQVGRLDLCVDLQGWCPKPEELDRFTTRVRRSKRGRWYGDRWLVEAADVEGDADAQAALEQEARRVSALANELRKAKTARERAQLLRIIRHEGEVDTAATYGDQRAFTGFTFGQGSPLSARIYDKLRELPLRRKWWARDIWRRNPRYKDGGGVWRVEFQLKREALKGFSDVEGPAFEPGSNDVAPDWGAWEIVRPRLASLWEYLAISWLRHGQREAKQRKVPSRQWREVVDGWAREQREEADRRVALAHRSGLDVTRADLLGEVEVDVERAAVRDSASVTVPAFAGYLSSTAAQIAREAELSGGKKVTAQQAIYAAVQAAWLYTEAKKERSVEQVAEEKTEGLRVRRAGIEGKGEAMRALRVVAATADAPMGPPLLLGEDARAELPTTLDLSRWRRWLPPPVKGFRRYGADTTSSLEVGDLVTMNRKEVGF